jgi:hypothetical protein
MSDDAPRKEPAESKGGGAVRPHGVKYAVVVEIDGRRLELKEFLHDVVGGAVDGLLGALRGVDAPRRIRVDVERR